MLRRGAAIGRSGPNLSGRSVTWQIGDECKLLAIRRPRWSSELRSSLDIDGMRSAAIGATHRQLATDNVANKTAMGDVANLADPLSMWHLAENSRSARGGGRFLRKKRRTEE